MVTWLSVSLLKPFRALRYDPERAGSLDRLVAPPYDVVTPELRAELLAESPYNAVRLVRPDAPEEAARALASWQSEGVLVRDEEPAVWVLEEDVRRPGRRRAEPSRAGRANPARALRGRGTSSRTSGRSPGPKEARLRLLRATRTKLSPILLLHEGKSPIVPAARPTSRRSSAEREAGSGGSTTRAPRCRRRATL